MTAGGDTARVVILEGAGRPQLEDLNGNLFGSIAVVGGVQVVLNAGAQVGTVQNNAAGHANGFNDRRLLRDYVSYHHDDRTHLGHAKATPRTVHRRRVPLVRPRSSPCPGLSEDQPSTTPVGSPSRFGGPVAAL